MSIILSIISRAEVIRNLVVAAVIIGLPLVWVYTHAEEAVHKYVIRQSRKTFFCGYTIEYIIQQNLLYNLERFVDRDLSSVYATLMMILLKDNRSARLVRCKFKNKSDEYWHSWVEFRYLGIWYALDPSWYDYSCLVVRRKGFDHTDSTGYDQVRSYVQFWANPTYHQIYHKLQQQQTSYLFTELLSLTDPDGRDDYQLGEQNGRQFRAVSFKNGRMVSSGVLDSIIQDNIYHEPPAQVLFEAMKEKDRLAFR